MSKTINMVIPDLIQDIKSRSKNLEFPTFPPLDTYLYGFHRKRLYIVAGRPGQFKTSFMLNLALRYSLDNKKVLYLSLEMSKESILERTIKIYCGYTDEQLLLQELTVEDFEKIEKYLDIIKETEWELYDNLGKNLLEVRTLVKQHRPDIVFVDFVQMIGVDLYKYEERLVLQEYTREMVRIAKEFALVFVLASQINRCPDTRKDKRPQLNELKGSGSLEENADVVLALHYPYYYYEKAKKNELEILILKNRYGDIGLVKLGVDPEKSVIYTPEEGK